MTLIKRLLARLFRGEPTEESTWHPGKLMRPPAPPGQHERAYVAMLRELGKLDRIDER